MESKNVLLVIEFARTHSATVVQRSFWANFYKQTPSRKKTCEWLTKYETTGFLRERRSTECPGISAQTVGRVWAVCLRNPRSSTNQTSSQLQMSQPTVWRIFRKYVEGKPYKVQLTLTFTPDDFVRHKAFLLSIPSPLGTWHSLRLVSGNEATFHVLGIIIRGNVLIWSTASPRVTIESVCDSPRIINTSSAVSTKLYYPSFLLITL